MNERNPPPAFTRTIAEHLARLLTETRHREHFHQQLLVWMEETKARDLKHKEWKLRRKEYFERKVKRSKRLRNLQAGPPEFGWWWDDYSPEQPLRVKSKKLGDIYAISGWTPPELHSNGEIDYHSPLYLPSKRLESKPEPRKPTLADQYAVIAAIHDRCLPDVPQINPWLAIPEVSLFELARHPEHGIYLKYDSLCEEVDSLQDSDRPAIEAMLAIVIADLQREERIKERISSIIKQRGESLLSSLPKGDIFSSEYREWLKRAALLIARLLDDAEVRAYAIECANYRFDQLTKQLDEQLARFAVDDYLIREENASIELRRLFMSEADAENLELDDPATLKTKLHEMRQALLSTDDQAHRLLADEWRILLKCRQLNHSGGADTALRLEEYSDTPADGTGRNLLQKASEPEAVREALSAIERYVMNEVRKDDGQIRFYPMQSAEVLPKDTSPKHISATASNNFVAELGGEAKTQSLADPIPVPWLRTVVPLKIVKGPPDKLAKWLNNRNVHTVKIANKFHAERADLLKVFATYKTIKKMIENYGLENEAD